MAKEVPENDTGWRWMQQPAIFADTFVVDVFQKATLARIAFAEYTDKDTAAFFRTSVVMPISDAKALVKALNREIKAAEEKLKEQTAPSGNAESPESDE